jgi:SsrA-binding protein
MTRMTPRSHQNPPNEPVIENRKARHAYSIGETLECGIQLRGTEIKSIRASQISLAEGWVRVQEQPLSLSLHGVHIAEYPPAGAKRQHEPIRTRNLLAHKREIKTLADQLRAKSATLVPLKIYFVRGKAKLLVGVGLGKRKADKREDLAKRDAKRDMDRAMSRRRL